MSWTTGPTPDASSPNWRPRPNPRQHAHGLERRRRERRRAVAAVAASAGQDARPRRWDRGPARSGAESRPRPNVEGAVAATSQHRRKRRRSSRGQPHGVWRRPPWSVTVRARRLHPARVPRVLPRRYRRCRPIDPAVRRDGFRRVRAGPSAAAEPVPLALAAAAPGASGPARVLAGEHLRPRHGHQAPAAPAGGAGQLPRGGAPRHVHPQRPLRAQKPADAPGAGVPAGRRPVCQRRRHLEGPPAGREPDPAPKPAGPLYPQ
jgi:hypothetical protein